jgi:GNAT superfamily N-acetyltransferase
MEIRIAWYNDALRPQVINLFAAQYGVDPESFNALFEKFYFHPYQKNKCLLVMALDGDTVAGFQSFFYWPYTYQGKTYNSFQSGNSLVHPGYRGKGIFNQMLSFIGQENKTAGIDLLMGFPVEASLRNFLKDKWNLILDLQWYVKLCNPFAFIPFKGGKNFTAGYRYFNAENPEKELLRLSQQEEFTVWRKGYLNAGFSYTFKKDGYEIIFHVKPNRRKKILHELVIGNILCSSEGAYKALPAALQALTRAARSSFGAHFLSLAINETCLLDLKTAVQLAGFTRSEKKIHFIVKPFGQHDFAAEPARWLLYRSDIDTW